MTRGRMLVIAVSLLVTVACLGVTVVALRGASEAEDREQAAAERAQEAIDRSPGHGSLAAHLADPAASAREAALRAYFDPAVLSALTRVGSAAFTAACAPANAGRTAQEIVD